MLRNKVYSLKKTVQTVNNNSESISEGINGFDGVCCMIFM